MKKGYASAKGRTEHGQYVSIPHQCLRHDNFTNLSHKAVRMLIDLIYQYNGKNNGDLTLAFAVLQSRGWKSKETIRLAILELIHYGWIIITRHGGLNRTPNLYAVTFKAIDDCNGKINVKATNTPPRNWIKQVDIWEKPERYKAIDERRKRNRETSIKKTLVRKPYLVGTEPVSKEANK